MIALDAGLVLCIVLIVFGWLALATWVVRLFDRWDLHADQRDVLPPPNVRSQRQDWDQHKYWQTTD